MKITNTENVEMSGKLFVQSKLMALGYDVSKVLKRSGIIDYFIADGKRIAVKSNRQDIRQKDGHINAVHFGYGKENASVYKADYLVIVVNALEKPTSYIMKNEEIKEFVHRDDRNKNVSSWWLHGSTNPQKFKEFKENWGKVKGQ